MSDNIPNNFKYGLIAHEGPSVQQDVPVLLEFDSGLLVVQGSPFALDERWREWIGTLFAERLERASFSLIARSPTDSPAILDGENKRLVHQAHCFHVALLIVKAMSCNSKPIKLTGSNEAGIVGVRQVTELDCPRQVRGSPLDQSTLTESDFRKAAELSKRIVSIYEEKSFSRLKRIVRAFVVGVTESFADLRLHQFVRCIEGFVLPGVGETARQMKSRTEVFIGPTFHKLIEQIYAVRSDVEHLHEPLTSVNGQSRREKIVELLRLSYITEGIARYLLFHLLSNPSLLAYFADDAALAGFWKGRPKDLWGEIFDLSSHVEKFNDAFIADDIEE